MEKTGQRSWMMQYVLPTFIMIVVMSLCAVFLDETVAGFVAGGVCWVVAFMTGYALRPVHPWVTPIAVVLFGVVLSYLAAAAGDYEPPGGIWVFIGGVILAGFPLLFLIFVGREVGLTREEMKPLRH